MKSKNCKCFGCGTELTLLDITQTSRIQGRTANGKLITNGSYPDHVVELRLRCKYCGTDYVISGYKHDLKNLLEW